jgi:hypothetical protein
MKRQLAPLLALLFTGLSAIAEQKTVNINLSMIILTKLSTKFEAAKVSDPSHVPVTATIQISEPMGSESIVYFKSRQLDRSRAC